MSYNQAYHNAALQQGSINDQNNVNSNDSDQQQQQQKRVQGKPRRAYAAKQYDFITDPSSQQHPQSQISPGMMQDQSSQPTFFPASSSFSAQGGVPNSFNVQTQPGQQFAPSQSFVQQQTYGNYLAPEIKNEQVGSMEGYHNNEASQTAQIGSVSGQFSQMGISNFNENNSQNKPQASTLPLNQLYPVDLMLHSPDVGGLYENPPYIALPPNVIFSISVLKLLMQND